MLIVACGPAASTSAGAGFSRMPVQPAAIVHVEQRELGDAGLWKAALVDEPGALEGGQAWPVECRPARSARPTG